MSMCRQLRWRRLAAVIAALAFWCGVVAGWDMLRDAHHARAAYDSWRLIERQETYEQRLDALGHPVCGPWEQVGPFQNILSVLQEPERNPGVKSVYRTSTGRAQWQTMPQYIDGCVNAIRVQDYDPKQIARRSTVCLGRTIRAASDVTLSVYFGADGGFAVSLNGQSLALNDKHGELQPGEERLALPLKAGENRLVIKVELNRTPCRFFFVPDLGEQPTEELLAGLEREFPLNRERPTGYRRLAKIAATDAEDAHYRLTEIPTPDDVLLEGGGLTFLPGGELAVSTRRGFVYVVTGATDDDPARARFREYAGGLHEALGIHSNDAGELHVVQRGALTQVLDRDGDGVGDTFRNVCSDWGLTGDYHEYTLDLERDAAGNFFTALCLSDEERRGVSTSNVPWRGWIVQITPNGKLVPWCFGLRCCNGLCWNRKGELFATDNQGQWVPATPVHHIRRDHFYGSPPGRKWVDQSPSPEARQRADGPPTPPAVWIPYEEFCMSATDLVCDATGGAFGPFADQFFVGDMMKGTIVRVALEQVNGEYQGACLMFRRGVGAVNRLAFGPDHRLYVARASRGWAGAGRGDGLARLEFTGRTPLEIESVHLRPDGFLLDFTLPLAADAVRDLAALTVEQFRYEYWEKYGSPKIDREILPVGCCALSQDRREFSVEVAGLKAGRVCHLSLPRLASASGEILLHTDAFYTINSLPDGASVARLDRPGPTPAP